MRKWLAGSVLQPAKSKTLAVDASAMATSRPRLWEIRALEPQGLTNPSRAESPVFPALASAMDAGCGNIRVLDVSMRSQCIFIFGGFAGNRLDSLGAPLLLDILGCAGTPRLIWRPRPTSASRGS